MADRTVRVAIIGDSIVLRGALRDAEGAMGSFSSRMKTAGANMTRIGRRMTVGLTLPLAALGAASVKAAVDWETAFTGVRKTVDGTEKDFANLERGLRDLAVESFGTAEELAGIAEAAGQVGIPVDEILDFTKVMSELGVTTDLAARDAATAIAVFANQTGLAIADADRFGSALVALGNSTAATESQILDMAGGFGNFAAALGFTDSEILGLAASMQESGVAAEAGGTAVQRVVNAMGQAASGNTELLEGFAAAAGTTADEFLRMIENDPAAAFTAFIEGFGQLNPQEQADALEDLGLKSERVLRTLGLLGDNAEDVAGNMDTATDAFRDNNALQDEAAQRAETTAEKWENVKDRFNELLIVVGEAVVPVLEDLADALADVAEEFGKLDEDTQNWIIIAAVAVAVLGPLLILFGALATAVGALATTTGLVIAAILAAGAALVWLYFRFDAIRGIVDGLWQAMQQVWDWLVGVATQQVWPALQLIAQGFNLIWRVASEQVWPALQLVWDILLTIGGWVADKLIGVLKRITSFVDLIYDAVKKAIEVLKELGRLALDGIIGNVQSLAGALSGALGTARSLISALTSSSLQDQARALQAKVDAKNFTGGIASGGVTLVGESGPELAFMPRGTRVRTASRTENALRRAPTAGPSVADIRAALNGMRFEMGDGFVQMVTREQRINDRAVA